MSGIIWILIPLVAIVGAYIIDYQKNKLKWQSKNSNTDDELKEIREMLNGIVKRIENLEAIAAAEPENFGGIEIPDPEDLKEENRNKVAQMAENRGN
jgi:tRNA(Ile)-lysidine synthase TilS/MesJ